MIQAIKGVPLLGVIAASGTGKTTLLRAVIPHLTAAGLRIGCVKHTHHPFEIDRPGKDSFLLRAAGASQMLLGSAGTWALMVDTGTERDAGLLELVHRFDLEQLDLVLVEGFHLEDIPKIEVHRVSLGMELASKAAAQVIAIASNQKPPPTLDVPVLDVDEPAAIADFIRAHMRAVNDSHPQSSIA
jgi:molybdopterin-guanine dinucleotide biosynthesis protein MobB